MGEGDTTPPAEHVAPPRDLEQLEEARKILLEDGYVPQAVIEYAELTGQPKPTSFDVVRGDGAKRALNNYMMLFTGAIKPDDEPLEELGGRSMTDLLRDRDEVAAALGLDINELIEAARRSRTADPHSEDSLLSFYRKVLPTFESLVRDKGYPVEFLKG